MQAVGLRALCRTAMEWTLQAKMFAHWSAAQEFLENQKHSRSSRRVPPSRGGQRGKDSARLRARLPIVGRPEREREREVSPPSCDDLDAATSAQRVGVEICVMSWRPATYPRVLAQRRKRPTWTARSTPSCSRPFTRPRRVGSKEGELSLVNPCIDHQHPEHHCKRSHT